MRLYRQSEGVSEETETRYEISVTCRSAEEAHVRSLLLHSLSQAGLGLRRIESEDLADIAKVCVTAETAAGPRKDAALEQIVGRLEPRAFRHSGFLGSRTGIQRRLSLLKISQLDFISLSCTPDIGLGLTAGGVPMSDIAAPMPMQASSKPDLNAKSGPATAIIFILLFATGLLFTAYSIYTDIKDTGAPVSTYLPLVLLGVALFIALGFEFVNGFHDTANAVATVIYTHSLPPQVAVVWSGFFNFLGVLFSTGAVAFGIVSLLPVELILQVGSDAGFAMVFALLFAAIIWNLGTWWLGLPASSSHTLIGSIIGVGITNALMRGRDGTAGVDWGQATKIGESLLYLHWSVFLRPRRFCSS